MQNLGHNILHGIEYVVMDRPDDETKISCRMAINNSRHNPHSHMLDSTLDMLETVGELLSWRCSNGSHQARGRSFAVADLKPEHMAMRFIEIGTVPISRYDALTHED